MVEKLRKAAPLVIGGTGGSGTRLVAQLCISADYHLGEHLNDSLDALNFYNFYDHWLTPYLSDSLDEMQKQILQAALQLIVEEMYSTVPPAQRSRWGWKTPRSLLLLPLLDRCIEGLRFIHVIRDGRDMAYSGNQNQLRKHGSSLLNKQQLAQPEPIQSITFWNIINLRAARYGQSVMRERYLWLRYEDIALNHVETIRQLADFLLLNAEGRTVLYGHAHSPITTGRWRQHPPEECRALTTAGEESLHFFGYL